jgi:hypothetical protein
MKCFYKFMAAVLTIWLLSVLTVSCSDSNTPVDRIELYPVHNPQEVPPGGALASPGKDPMPTYTWDFPERIVTSIYVGVRISENLKEDVTFTKYTIFDPADSSEYEVGLPEELGPYEPGQIPLLNHNNPWPIPAERGQYEFRIYLDDRVVSRAIFNVVD